MKLVRRKETAKIDKTNNSLWKRLLPACRQAFHAKWRTYSAGAWISFGLQEGDEFTVIFDERWIDTVRVGTGMVWGQSSGTTANSTVPSPSRQDGRVAYWDENGNSLRRQFLKRPLK